MYNRVILLKLTGGYKTKMAREHFAVTFAMPRADLKLAYTVAMQSERFILEFIEISLFRHFAVAKKIKRITRPLLQYCQYSENVFNSINIVRRKTRRLLIQEPTMNVKSFYFKQSISPGFM